MISGRILELLVLNSLLSVVSTKKFEENNGIIPLSTGEEIDGNKLVERQSELVREFLSPYVIDKNLKE